jgi:hypothetical protein
LVDITRVGYSLMDELGYERRLLAHDAFRPGALGDQGWMVARWLSDENPIDIERLAKSTGLALNRVMEVVDALEWRGAVGPSGPNGLVRSLEPMFFDALDHIATDAGSFGTLERERETYAAERAKRDAQYPDTSRSLFVTVPDPAAWWSTWWGSLSEKAVPHAA